MHRMVILVLFVTQCQSGYGARILGVFPVPSVSHQIVFRPFMQELAKNGHEVVIITPNPALPKERPPDNITEIDTSAVYQLLAKFYDESQGNNLLKKGVVHDIDAVLLGDADRGMSELISYQLQLHQVKAFLEDKTQKFDLIFIEAIANYHLIVTNIFKAPVIWFSSFYGFPEHHQSMGAVAWHPVYYPYFYRQNYGDLTLWEKIYETYLEWKLFKLIDTIEEYDNDKLKLHYGPKTPNIEELKKNVQMLFVNSHPIFGSNRPVPPSVIHLGALHLEPPKELPMELKRYLDDSSRSVVYVSFGSNVRPSMMDRDLQNTFLTAFEALPFEVLWRFDSDDLQNIPKNVKIQKWFPQRDLLMHPKIKVFITQGGLQSTDEAIDAKVPVVGLPMLADQWFNINKCVELGIGEKLDVLTLTAKNLVDTVVKVASNDSYRNNIGKLYDIINDQPQKPLQRAVWWTEHVLRHGDASHLQAPSAHWTWKEFLMIDVVYVVCVIVVAFFIILLFVAENFFKLFRSKSNIKLKST